MQVPDEDRRKIAAYYTLPFGFAAAVGLFVALGLMVDARIGSTPAFTIIGLIIGLAVGLFYLIRHALEIQKGDGAVGKDNNGSSEP